MIEPDYWKELYKQTWEQAASREKKLKLLLEKMTGKTVVFVGLGAGSQEYLSGSAQSQGYEKGSADLHIENTNVYIEVTGPLSARVDSYAPLWLRPDKVQAAELHFPERETWVIHHLTKDNTLRVIWLNGLFFEAIENKQITLVHPRIRGVVETYYQIPFNHTCVKPFKTLIDRINSR